MADSNLDARLARSREWMTPEMYAEADAIAAAHAANPKPLEVDPRGADPLGTDWAWAGGSLVQPTGAPGEAAAPPVAAQTQTVQSVPVPSVTEPVGTTRAPRRLTYALGAALAASVLVALTALALGYFRDSGPQTFALVVEPSRIQFFGTEQPQPTLKNSPMNGYIAAVGVSRAGDVRVWPTERDRPGAPVPVRKSDLARVGPLPEDVEYVVVVVTEQPATAALIQEFGREKIPPEQRVRLEQRITAALRAQNYRNLAAGQAEY